MGISYKTYVGPYVRCVVEFKDVEKTRRACPNTACKSYGETRFAQGEFCAKCGTPIGDVSYTERIEAVDRWEVSEEIDQHLCDPGGDGYIRWVEANKAHLWKPNIDAGIARDGHLESRVDFALSEIQAAEIQTEIERFTQFFAQELAHFRSRYGADVVSIHWGVIQDYY